MEINNIIISGFGGQGIVAAGKTVAHAGMLDKKIVSMLPSYGPEMRGGFANCSVIISDNQIASPIVSKADVLIAMSHPAVDKFRDRVKTGGTLIVDSSQVDRQEYRKDINVIEIPATKIAMDIGNVKFANVVMIGVMMSVIGAPSIESISKAIKAMLPKHMERLYDSEMKALDMGINCVKEKHMNVNREYA